MDDSISTVLIEPNVRCRDGIAWVLSNTRFHPVALVACVGGLDDVPLTADRCLFFLADFGTQPQSAAEEVRKLKILYPKSLIAVMADSCDQRHMGAVMRAGADGYLIKSMNADALVKSLDLLTLGERVIPAEALDGILPAGGDLPHHPAPLHCSHPLSGREVCVLRRIAQGESNKLIARTLDISEATVKVHIKAILRKIQVRNRTQAAIWALDNGLSSEPERVN